MSRYVDIEKMPSGPNWDALNDKEKAAVLSFLIQLPTANVVPVIHGHWSHVTKYLLYEIGTCSVCGERVDVDNYCSNCGAIMDKEKE